MARGGGDNPSAADVMLREIMGSQNHLHPRPSSEELESALQVISDIEKRLIAQLEELILTPCPAGIEEAQFRSLQRLKEDRMRKDAEMEKRKHMAVVKVEDEHKHYEELKHQAEKVLVAGSGTNGAMKVLSAVTSAHNAQSIAIPRPKQLKKSDGKGIPSPEEEETDEQRTWTSSPPTSSPIDIGSKAGRQKSTYASTISTVSPVSVGQKLTTIDENGGFRVSDFPRELIYMVEDAFAEGRDKLDISQLFGHKLLKVPDTISDCVSLTVLNLAEQQLEMIPESVGSLVNLVTLDLHSNKLKELPESIGFLEKLVFLNLHSNQLEEFPITIGNCTKLQSLIADFNQLKNLPESIGQLVELRVLILHLNRIKRIPATIGELSKLEELDLHFNHLDFIPDTVGKLTSLKKLDLCSNFSELKGLPTSIGDLPNLTDLNLSYNGLKTLPDTFGNLRTLKKLKLDGNPLVVPPPEVVEQGIEAVLNHMDKRKEQAESKALKKTKNPFTRFWSSMLSGHKDDEFGSMLSKDLNTLA